MLFRWLGWINTPLPLIVPALFGLPYFIFLFRQFFKGVPLELEEAALLNIPALMIDPKGDITNALELEQTLHEIAEMAAMPGYSLLVAEDGAFAWRWDAAPLDAGWNQVGFDDAAWPVGAGPVGYGSALVGTDVSAGGSRRRGR